MKHLKKIELIYGGMIRDESISVQVYLYRPSQEERIMLPSGDMVTFTLNGIFSDKNICVANDPDFFERNKDFQLEEFRYTYSGSQYTTYEEAYFLVSLLPDNHNY